MSGTGKKRSIPRAGIAVRLILQTLCVLFLVGVANYLGFHYFERWDFSRSQKFVLADQTKRVLRDLEEPIKITVFLSPTNQGIESMIIKDVGNLLRELQFSRERTVEVEMVDPVRDFSRARELQTRYGFDGADNVLILDYQGRVKFVPVVELGDFDLSGVAIGEPPRLRAFRGEVVITSAVIELANPVPPRAYFVVGHGEMMPGVNPGLSTVSEYIARQNIEVAPLSFADVDRVPEDAEVVFIVAPRFDLQPRELEALAEYWNGDGRLIVLLNPDTPTPALREFLAERGVVPLDLRVLRTVPLQGGVVGIVRDVVGIFLDDTTITRRLTGVSGLFPGATQPLEADTERAAAAGVRLRPLVQAAEEFWGESDYVDTSAGVAYEDDRDLASPVVIAAQAERGGVADDRVELRTARLVVVGNADFITDDAIRLAPANLDFLLAVLNWTIERTNLIGIAPKPVTLISLSLTQTELRAIAFYTLVVMPGVIALLAIIVGWRRRV